MPTDSAYDVQRFARQQMQALLARSAIDPAVRRLLLTDPRAVITEFTGRELPASFNVVFVENKAGATIVLPDPVWSDDGLPGERLEHVSGGVGTPDALGDPGFAALMRSLSSGPGMPGQD